MPCIQVRRHGNSYLSSVVWFGQPRCWLPAYFTVFLRLWTSYWVSADVIIPKVFSWRCVFPAGVAVSILLGSAFQISFYRVSFFVSMCRPQPELFIIFCMSFNLFRGRVKWEDIYCFGTLSILFAFDWEVTEKLLFPVCRSENWSSSKLKNLPQTTLLGSPALSNSKVLISILFCYFYITCLLHRHLLLFFYPHSF